jgi:uncharacterized membrane protein
MENKNVGYLILGISALIAIIIFLYRNALKSIVEATCSAAHGDVCPMYMSIDQQTYLALAIVGVLVLIGIILILSKPTEKIIIKKVKEKVVKKKINMSDLRKEDKEVLKLVQKEGATFQADLIEKTGFGKAKMSRVIDRLEGKGIVERKRRGLTNVVVMKDN